jgi:hypothetical protein
VTPEEARLQRLQREAQRSTQNPPDLSGVVWGAGSAAGMIKVQMPDGGIVEATQLDDRGHQKGTKVRLTRQSGRYFAAGPTREGR